MTTDTATSPTGERITSGQIGYLSAIIATAAFDPAGEWVVTDDSGCRVAAIRSGATYISPPRSPWQDITGLMGSEPLCYNVHGWEWCRMPAGHGGDCDSGTGSWQKGNT